MYLLMLGLEASLEGLLSNIVTMIVAAAALGIIVYIVVSKISGNERIGGFSAGAAILFCAAWLTKKGTLIEFLSTIR